MKISTLSITTIKDSENAFAKDVWDTLQNNLLGTVSNLNAGDYYNIDQTDFDTTLSLLRKRGIRAIELNGALGAASSFENSIAGPHDYDIGSNGKLMSDLSNLIKSWVN